MILLIYTICYVYYSRLPPGIDDENFSLSHSQENLINESDESDIFLSEDMIHCANNNLDKPSKLFNYIL